MQSSGQLVGQAFKKNSEGLESARIKGSGVGEIFEGIF